VPVPHLDSGIDWAREAEPLRQRVQQRLEATVLPGLGRHLVTSRVTTPQQFHDELLSYKGAAFGMEPRLMQSAWFRPHNRSEDVPGLYLVGAGTHPGAGVPGVLMSAKALETVLPPLAPLPAERVGIASLPPGANEPAQRGRGRGEEPSPVSPMRPMQPALPKEAR
jgi:phytoene desaturase